MAKQTVFLTGDREFDAKLRDLERKEARKIIVSSIRVAMKPVLKEARADAPVRTGLMRRNIKLKAFRRSRRRIGLKVTSTAGDAKADQHGVAFYGAFSNYGRKTGTRESIERREIPGTYSMVETGKREARGAIETYRKLSGEKMTEALKVRSGS